MLKNVLEGMTARNMRRVLLFVYVVILILRTASPAMADLCVLKNGDYNISGTPCADADGNGDDIIDLAFSVGEALALDIVYEQTVGPYEVELFTYLMFYDTANMNGATVTCNPDPSDYFNDDMCQTLGLPVCTTPNGGSAGNAVDSNGIKIVQQTFMNFSANKAPDPPVNFVLDQVVFSNGYTSPSANHNPGSEKYTIDFSTSGGSPTEVGLLLDNGDRCAVLTGTQDCADNGIARQTIMKSRIFIDAPSTYIGPPSNAQVVSCTYSGSGVCADGEPATAVLTYNLPNQCWADVACTTAACRMESPAYGVRFNAADGTTVSTTSTTYTDTSAVIGTNVSYTLIGIDTRFAGGMSDSSSLICTSSATASAACECGDPPVITLLNEDKYGDTCTSCMTFVNGADIRIRYKLTDADGTLPDSIPAGNIIFFYTNDLSPAVTVRHYIVTDLDAEGNFTGIISDEYVNGTDLYFSVMATDEDGQVGEMPEGLSCTIGGSADCLSSANKINNDSICLKCGYKFGFLTGNEPAPDQYPFRAGSGEPLNIYFAISEVSNVTMRIYSMDGMLVRTLENSDKTFYAGSTCSGEGCNICNWQSGCRWDGSKKSGGGNIVSSGMYIINIHAVATGDNFYGQRLDLTKGIVVMK